MERFEKMILPVIVGPTCIGKTSLALEISKKIGCDILSIDSRQVFKELDLGTGKYKGDKEVHKKDGYWEVDGVKIWGYDILNLNEELNVIKYCEFAKKIIEDYSHKNQKLIATCGTGFYLDFLMGNINFNFINEERKKELQSFSIDKLLEIFHSFENYPIIDENNKPRIVTSILSLENTSNEVLKFEILDCNFKLLNLKIPRNVLYKNADEFVEEIFSKDVLNEFKTNFEKYGDVKPLQGIIYKELSLLNEKKIAETQAKDLTKFSLHRYIKRQETYFKKFTFELSSENREQVSEKIQELL